MVKETNSLGLETQAPRDNYRFAVFSSKATEKQIVAAEAPENENFKDVFEHGRGKTCVKIGSKPEFSGPLVAWCCVVARMVRDAGHIGTQSSWTKPPARQPAGVCCCQGPGLTRAAGAHAQKSFVPRLCEKWQKVGRPLA